jgi:chromosome segregation ATPase
MKIKIQKRAEQFNIRKRYKKGDVVVIKGEKPLIATVIRMVANGVVETTSHSKIAAQALRPATSIEMRYVKDKRWAEIEFVEDKPKEVKPKIEEKPQSYTNMIAENLKTIDQKDKKINDLEIELEVYVNHSKFLENQTAKQSIEIRELQAEIRSLKDRIDANNKHTLQLLDTQKTSKTFYI